MSIPKIVLDALIAAEVEFKEVELPEPMSFQHVADHLGTNNTALLRPVAFSNRGKPLIALLPYPMLLDLKQLEGVLQSHVELLADSDYSSIFKDCQYGSWAPVPHKGLSYLLDDSIFDLSEVYICSGNPQILLNLSIQSVNQLYQETARGDFSAAPERIYSGRDLKVSGKELDISFTPIRLKQRVDETFDLPAMPDIAKDIMKLRVSPSADASKLGEIVSRDPSLAAQVISWASSPYYGYQGKVDSVETAIARVLGFELVMNLALGISIGKSLKVPLDGPLGIRQFWKQAIYSANLADKLCRAMPLKQRPERGLIYLSGLLHNFGHLLLGHIFPPQFELLNRTIEANPHIEVEDIEFYILGVTHEEIGAWLMQNWHMPEELIVAVRRHHQEEFWSKHAVFSNLVLIANRLLKRIGIGDAVNTQLPKSTMELLSLDEATLEGLLVDIEREAETLDMMAKQLVA